MGTNGKPGVVAMERKAKIARLQIGWGSIKAGKEKGGEDGLYWHTLQAQSQEGRQHCLYFWLVDITQISNKLPLLLERLLSEGSL